MFFPRISNIIFQGDQHAKMYGFVSLQISTITLLWGLARSGARTCVVLDFNHSIALGTSTQRRTDVRRSRFQPCHCFGDQHVTAHGRASFQISAIPLFWGCAYIKISSRAKTGGKYSAPTIEIESFVIQKISIFLLNKFLRIRWNIAVCGSLVPNYFYRGFDRIVTHISHPKKLFLLFLFISIYLYPLKKSE